MKITSVHVTKFTDGKLRGIATVVLDDCFKIKGIRIYETDDKLKLAMPSRKDKSGEDRDIAHPLNAQTREMFEKAITEFAEKYHSLLKKSKPDTVLRNFEKHLIFSWREAVTEHYNVNPFLPDEIERFDEAVIEELRENYHITYGSRRN